MIDRCKLKMDKGIVLFGELTNCIQFYLMMRDVMDIKKIMTIGYTSIKKVKNVSIVEFDAKYIIQNELYIIVCCETIKNGWYDKYLNSKGFIYEDEYRDAYLYYQLFIRKQGLLEKIIKKKIWIFGAGNNGKKFLENFSKSLNIQGFVSTYATENRYMEMPVVRLDSLEKEKDIYIVICSEAKEDIHNELVRLNKKPVLDFIFQDYFPRKLLIAIGNCQIQDPVTIFSTFSSIIGKYHICQFFETTSQHCTFANKKRMMEYGEVCDVVIYGAVLPISDNLIDYSNFIDKYYKEARCICFPSFYHFTGQHIQTEDTVNPYLYRRYEGGMLCSYGDQEINRMIEDGYTDEEIIEQILSDEYRSKEEVIENFNRELKKIKILDRKSNVPLENYIRENYRYKFIFRDGKHFSTELSCYIASQIARILGITEMGDMTLHIDLEKESVMPIYPCVAKALGLEFLNDEYKYNFINSKNEIEKLSFKEYEMRYIRFVRAVKSILDETGTYWTQLPLKK